ncbi:helix-turn-helix domain-containing protein [Streptomyces sp. NPDC047061]|uniref:helix-turn-helix domain-containing protein n=1 Tax=Streptomyces sp. NPDC047061 TaxID=3154605 RepID=UPI0033E96988
MSTLTAASAEEWAQLCSESFVPCGIDHVALDFKGRLDESALTADSAVIRVNSQPMDVVRSSRHVANSVRDDYYMLVVHGGGGAGVVEQSDEMARIHPGDAVLVDMSRPYRWWFPAAIDQVVLKVSHDMLGNRGHDPSGMFIRALPSALPALRVLSVFLKEVAAVAGQTEDPLLLAELGHTAGDLLTTALRSADGAPERAVAGRRAMLRSMQQCVRDNLAEPGLAPATLAARFGVSVRFTTALFHDSGTTPAAYIRDQRLESARRALTDPRRRGVGVAVIAGQAGFADATTFTRAFRRRFGVNPAQYRADAATD